MSTLPSIPQPRICRNCQRVGTIGRIESAGTAHASCYRCRKCGHMWIASVVPFDPRTLVLPKRLSR